MAAITNWQSAGSAASKASLQSVQLAQADERLRQARADAAWSRKRAEAQDAESARRFDAQQRNADRSFEAQQKNADRAFEAQRADAAWNRKRAAEQDKESARRFDAQQRNADRAFDAQRADAAWNQAYQQRAQDFQQLLAQDELERKREMRRREDAQYEQLMKQQADARAQQEASFASLLRYGVQAGEMKEDGMILVPPAYIDQFNKTNGAQLGGVAILTRGENGAPLDYPQVMLMNRDGQGNVVPGGVMSNAQVRMMFEAFPDVSDEMAKKAGLTAGGGNAAWLRTLGIRGGTRNDDTARDDAALRRDAADYYKSALEMIGKRKKELMKKDVAADALVAPDKVKYPSEWAEFNRLSQEELAYQQAWAKALGIEVVGDSGGGATEAGMVPEAGGGASTSGGAQSQKPKRKRWEAIGTRGAL